MLLEKQPRTHNFANKLLACEYLSFAFFALIVPARFLRSKKMRAKHDEVIDQAIVDFIGASPNGRQQAEIRHYMKDEIAPSATFNRLRRMVGLGRLIEVNHSRDVRYYVASGDEQSIEKLEKESDVAGTTSKKGHNGNVSIQ
jgi:hypothetical protein